jgi:hypothetical protein
MKANSQGNFDEIKKDLNMKDGLLNIFPMY